MTSILSYARVAHDEALKWFHWRHYAHFGTIVSSLLVVFIPHPANYFILIVLLASESFAWLFRYNALKYHSLSRAGMRRAMIADGLGMTWDEGETQNFAQRIDARLRKLANQRAGNSSLPSHFTTEETAGWRRLYLHLLESVFWQKHLYRCAARDAALKIAAFLALFLMVVLLLMPFISHSLLPVAASGLIELLLFLTVWDEFEQNLGWRSSASSLDVIFERLYQKFITHSLSISKAEVMISVADYAVATSTTAPVPKRIYDKEFDSLDKAWRNILAKIPKSPSPGPVHQ